METQPECLEVSPRKSPVFEKFPEYVKYYCVAIIGEPLYESSASQSLAEICQGLQNWKTDLEEDVIKTELQSLAEAKVFELDQKYISSHGENFGLIILINPTAESASHQLDSLFSHASEQKLLVYGGHRTESGDWVLQDQTFTSHDLENSSKKICNLDPTGNKKGTFTFNNCHWPRSSLAKCNFEKSCDVFVNLSEAQFNLEGVDIQGQLIEYMKTPSPFDLLEPPNMGIGVKCKITKPTVLIFPAAKGDCAFVAANDFNLFVNGGYSNKSCFWKFSKHLSRIDSLLVQSPLLENIAGVNSLIKRKIAENELVQDSDNEEFLKKSNSPELGVIYANLPKNVKAEPITDSFTVRTTNEGNRTVDLLQKLGKKAVSCVQSGGKIFESMTLYQKVGIGKLDMFVLSPTKESKELKDFYHQWNEKKKFSSVKTGIKVNGKEQEILIPHLTSIVALIVWQPHDPNEKVVRLLFPGSTSQNRILEGLDRCKHLEFLKHPENPLSSKKPAKEKVSSSTFREPPPGPPEEVVCADGIHCNTPPPGEDTECTDGIHCNTPPPEEEICTDGIHCNTPPPGEDAECTDGIHCNTPPPEEEEICTDGIHCNTPPPDPEEEPQNEPEKEANLLQFDDGQNDLVPSIPVSKSNEVSNLSPVSSDVQNAESSSALVEEKDSPDIVSPSGESDQIEHELLPDERSDFTRIETAEAVVKTNLGESDQQTENEKLEESISMGETLAEETDTLVETNFEEVNKQQLSEPPELETESESLEESNPIREPSVEEIDTTVEAGESDEQQIEHPNLEIESEQLEESNPTNEPTAEEDDTIVEASMGKSEEQQIEPPILEPESEELGESSPKSESLVEEIDTTVEALANIGETEEQQVEPPTQEPESEELGESSPKSESLVEEIDTTVEVLANVGEPEEQQVEPPTLEPESEELGESSPKSESLVEEIDTTVEALANVGEPEEQQVEPPTLEAESEELEESTPESEPLLEDIDTSAEAANVGDSEEQQIEPTALETENEQMEESTPVSPTTSEGNEKKEDELSTEENGNSAEASSEDSQQLEPGNSQAVEQITEQPVEIPVENESLPAEEPKSAEETLIEDSSPINDIPEKLEEESLPSNHENAEEMQDVGLSLDEKSPFSEKESEKMVEKQLSLSPDLVQDKPITDSIQDSPNNEQESAQEVSLSSAQQEELSKEADFPQEDEGSDKDKSDKEDRVGSDLEEDSKSESREDLENSVLNISPQIDSQDKDNISQQKEDVPEIEELNVKEDIATDTCSDDPNSQSKDEETGSKEHSGYSSETPQPVNTEDNLPCSDTPLSEDLDTTTSGAVDSTTADIESIEDTVSSIEGENKVPVIQDKEKMADAEVSEINSRAEEAKAINQSSSTRSSLQKKKAPNGKTTSSRTKPIASSAPPKKNGDKKENSTSKRSSSLLPEKNLNKKPQPKGPKTMMSKADVDHKQKISDKKTTKTTPPKRENVPEKTARGVGLKKSSLLQSTSSSKPTPKTTSSKLPATKSAKTSKLDKKEQPAGTLKSSTTKTSKVPSEAAKSSSMIGTQRKTTTAGTTMEKKKTTLTATTAKSSATSVGTKNANSKSSVPLKKSKAGFEKGSASKKEIIPVSGPPVYLDLVYVPNHGGKENVNIEFFRRIRAKYYVFSGNDEGADQPSKLVLNAFLEAKIQWNQTDNVVLIPTYDTKVLKEWEQENRSALLENSISIAAPAAESIVQMRNEVFNMTKVEF